VEKLFGLEMGAIAGCLSSALILVLAVLALLAWRRPVMFKLGLRPIPRRRAQSTLIVFGLMLATLIITAAFGTGDTLSHTIRSLAIEGLGEMDEVIRVGGGTRSFGVSRSAYFKLSRYEALAAQLADYALVDAVIPAIRASVPVVDATQRRSLRSLSIMGLRAQDMGVLAREEITDAQGRPLALEALGAHEVYLNAKAGRELNAAPGDTLELYIGPRPKRYTVRAIAAQGDDPRLLLSLRQAQVLFNQRGKINLIVISNSGDALGGAAHSEQVTAHLRGLLSDPTVAAQLFSMLAQGPSAADALREAAAKERGNTQTDLLALADGLAAGTLTPKTRSLLADEGLASRVQSILAGAGWGSPPVRERLEALWADLSELGVDDAKRDTLDQGELAASAFTTIFIVAGLFGIAAGLILIFLIFVMLAAERKSEMGMTRAVGGQRRHLVEMFTFEGTAYDLAAAAVGVALGAITGIIIALTLGQAFAGQGDIVIRPSVTPRSLLVSYSLGMLVTFATVFFSAYKVSRLNIVAAIRDLPEPARPPRYLRDRLLAPFRAVADGFRDLLRLRLLRALWAWLVDVPLSVWRIVWLGFTSGPLMLLLGLILLPMGIQAASAAPYSLGVSAIIIGGGLTLRGLLALFLKHWPGLVDRVAFTVMGLALTIFWSLPFDAFKDLGVPEEMSSGPEMLFISGILLVAGAVLVIMYNTDLLLRVSLALLGDNARFAPVLRMAIAYPLSNRFRTGMTIGIFAVVVFSVIFMATAFKVNEAFFADTEALTGGFDLRVATSSTNPIDDLADVIAAQSGLRRADYAVIAAQTSLPVELRQGQGRWDGYVAQAVDEAFLENIGYDLSVKAEGYASAAEVWGAVRDHPGYAVIDRYAVPSRQTTSIVIGGPEFKLQGVYLEDETMPPLQVQVRDPTSQATFEVTVIGIIEQEAFTSYGLYVSQATLERALPSALPPPTYYIRLAPGADPRQAGAALESVFLKHGLESVDQIQEIKDAQVSQRVIEKLLLGFLTLGLVVGVAALGVISTRAVVERRQQIGMLRALGFQREMVAGSFLIESSFIALLGIGLGAGLALIPAYHMINNLAVEVPGLRFQVPWDSILFVLGLAYGMTLLTTWLPAVQASRVRPAEALRYE
jgi:putative ABC transport system permease protein